MEIIAQNSSSPNSGDKSPKWVFLSIVLFALSDRDNEESLVDTVDSDSSEDSHKKINKNISFKEKMEYFDNIEKSPTSTLICEEEPKAGCSSLSYDTPASGVKQKIKFFESLSTSEKPNTPEIEYNINNQSTRNFDDYLDKLFEKNVVFVKQIDFKAKEAAFEVMLYDIGLYDPKEWVKDKEAAILKYSDYWDEFSKDYNLCWKQSKSGEINWSDVVKIKEKIAIEEELSKNIEEINLEIRKDHEISSDPSVKPKIKNFDYSVQKFCSSPEPTEAPEGEKYYDKYLTPTLANNIYFDKYIAPFSEEEFFRKPEKVKVPFKEVETDYYIDKPKIDRKTKIKKPYKDEDAINEYHQQNWIKLQPGTKSVPQPDSSSEEEDPYKKTPYKKELKTDVLKKRFKWEERTFEEVKDSLEFTPDMYRFGDPEYFWENFMKKSKSGKPDVSEAKLWTSHPKYPSYCYFKRQFCLPIPCTSEDTRNDLNKGEWDDCESAPWAVATAPALSMNINSPEFSSHEEAFIQRGSKELELLHANEKISSYSFPFQTTEDAFLHAGKSLRELEKIFPKPEEVSDSFSPFIWQDDLVAENYFCIDSFDRKDICVIHHPNICPINISYKDLHSLDELQKTTGSSHFIIEFPSEGNSFEDPRVFTDSYYLEKIIRQNHEKPWKYIPKEDSSEEGGRRVPLNRSEDKNCPSLVPKLNRKKMWPPRRPWTAKIENKLPYPEARDYSNRKDYLKEYKKIIWERIEIEKEIKEYFIKKGWWVPGEREWEWGWERQDIYREILRKK